MAFTIKDAWLPATLTAVPMTDEEFAAVVAEHPDQSFEMSADGELIVMPPNYSTTGARNARIVAQLFNWAEHDQRGTAFDSSAGFVFPNRARRSPDASWVSNERIGAEDRSREGYLHLCPDFAIELRSDSDRLRALREKLKEYVENGAQLAWLIDPLRQAVEIFRKGCAPEVREGIMMIEGEGPVRGFALELQRIWKPWQ
jgi:Uma2 family endonuclease